VRIALERELINSDTTVFDYGCGLGDDLLGLQAMGVEAFGWDPIHRPDGERLEADVVNLGYVTNVIDDATERSETLKDAWRFAKWKSRVIYWTNRSDS